MNSFIKLACLNIINTPDSEIVKVAGILRRLKNWLKSKTDSSFRETVDQLNSENEVIKQILIEIDKSSSEVQSAIKDMDLSSYREALEKLKEQSKLLLIKVNQNIKEVDNAQQIKKQYSAEEIKNPEVAQQIKTVLPDNFDVPFGLIKDKFLKDFEYYKDLSPDSIFISENSIQALILKLNEKNIKLDPNLNQLAKNFKEAIVNGKLIEVALKVPGKTHKNVEAGMTHLVVSTAPFSLPGTNISIVVEVFLTDSSTGISRRKIISVSRIQKVTVLSKTALRLYELSKFSKELPLSYTQLTEKQLADVLSQGYKKAFGKEPKLETLAFGWAQSILESGRPVKLPNNNIGNIKATSNWIDKHDYFVKSTKEINRQSGKEYLEVGTKWRAYDTPIDGAAAYWSLLYNKFPEAFKLIEANEPESAAISLGKSTYYTANIEKYSAAVKSLYKEFMQTIAPELKGHVTIKNVSNHSNDNEIDNFVSKLVASPLTDKVKKSLLKKAVNQNTVLISLFEQNLSDQILFAKKACYLINKYLGANTKILADKNVQIEVFANANPISLTKSSQAICDCLHQVFQEQFNKKLTIISAPNVSSNKSEIL